MDTPKTLQQMLSRVAVRSPKQIAVDEPGHGSITYEELDALSDQLRDRLHYLGIRPGDRVGIYLKKSLDSVAAIFGILKAGAAYVPVDPGAPVARSAYIFHDCAVKMIMLENRFAAALRTEIASLGSTPQMFLLFGCGGGKALREALAQADAEHKAPLQETVASAPDALAYVLYTSGSTGKPKGVMLSQGNARGFVDWCSEVFAPQPEDRFSSHAPFHFDLSILDLFVSIKHGASLVLVSEEAGKDPTHLAALIEEKRISIWYSAPSILSLLAQYGNLETRDYSSLRLVLFAGEVFPVKHLQTLSVLWAHPRYFNLYGPTETNVCTFYEVPKPIPADRTIPFPIGKTCSHLQGLVVDEQGQEVLDGSEGELCIQGSSVMQGYWNLPEQSARAFLISQGQQWYKTGDIVTTDSNGDYIFIGRRDRMVKRRGYRVELGEIEAALYRHSAIKEAAVIALSEPDTGICIKAFLSCREGNRPSLIELKRFCAENLPLYMVPDRFAIQAELPKTSTDKIDYQRLNGVA